MSEFSAIARNAKPLQAGRYIHTEDAKHPIAIVVSVIWLIVGAAFGWEIWKDCTSACATGEYLLMLSPLVGAMMLAYGCRQIYLCKRLGEVVLQLQLPLHPACSDVPATLYFMTGLGQGMRHPAATHPLALEIVCTHVENSGEDASTKTLWSQKFKDRHVAQGAGSVDFTLGLPADLPASGALGRTEIKIIWKLQVRVLGGQSEFCPAREASTSGKLLTLLQMPQDALYTRFHLLPGRRIGRMYAHLQWWYKTLCHDGFFYP